MNRLFTLAGLLTTSMFTTNAMAETISIGRMDVHDIKSSYFQLKDDEKVEIEFLAPKMAHDDEQYDFAWIIDLQSREMVWRSRRADVMEQGKNKKLNVYSDKVSLDKGRYGLFFSTHNFRYGSNRSGMDFFLYGLSSLLRDNRRISHDDIEEFYIDLRASQAQPISRDKELNPFTNAQEIVALRKVRKNCFQQFGLDIPKNTELSIYALGEISGRDEADFAWLKDANTGEVIWKMDQRSTEPAGGANKNRQFKGTISVAKGSYVLSYSSDSSHHYNDWNNQPPYDPQAWGVSVYGKKGINITQFDPQQRLNEQSVLAINRVGDNASLRKHFKLEKDTAIRIVALGERAGHESMADYGWIINNNSHEKVWRMKASKTEHAGGSSKNRVSDETITLPAGEYTVNYVSDDSHSYDDGWNASRPYNETQWGISLYGVGADFDKKSVKMLKTVNSHALAQLIRVGDDMLRTSTFELKEDQSVRVYAIGEGDSGDMADYGYIKNVATGKRVWNMFADETEHAGGAGKNRLVNQVIDLKKGKYKVYFSTDGSHSFEDWNASPPTDQNNYGISVYKVK